MTKDDMILLIELEDALADMDKALEELTGYGHSDGNFVELDNAFTVLYHNSHAMYHSESPEKGQELFFGILMNRSLTPAERTEILMNGLYKNKQ